LGLYYEFPTKMTLEISLNWFLIEDKLTDVKYRRSQSL